MGEFEWGMVEELFAFEQICSEGSRVQEAESRSQESGAISL